MAASENLSLAGSGYDPEAILVGLPLMFKCSGVVQPHRLEEGIECFSSLTSAPPQRESALGACCKM